MEFKRGDRVFHRNLKKYGTYIEKDFEEGICYVEFDEEYGEKETLRVSESWLSMSPNIKA